MLSPEILKKIQYIQMKASFLASDVLTGNYRSAFRGHGMEFDEVRQYIPGDDVRFIDWNVTARMNEPYLKIYREERELTLMVLTDVSPSMKFGSQKNFKFERAAEISALLSFLAIRNQDKVGSILFSDHIEKYIPPKKGKSHVWNIIRETLTHQGRGKNTDYETVFNYLLQVQKKKSTCFLISDFLNWNFSEPTLRAIAKKHELIAVHLKDEREWNYPPAGIFPLKDLESQKIKILGSFNKKIAKRMREQELDYHKKLYQFFRQEKISCIELEHHDEFWLDKMIYFFQKRMTCKRKH